MAADGQASTIGAVERDIERILIGEAALDARVGELAREIEHTYADAPEGLTLVTVLAGSMIFAADLMRHLPFQTRIGLVAVSSYAGGTTISRGPAVQASLLPELAGRDVLIVDDILDTGATLRLVQDDVRRMGPRSLRTVVLLRKVVKASADVVADFVGFEIEDAFVVGYGLDYNGWYRNLPYIAVLRPEAYRV
jgi:hypoxanthine phosphoribosyltransferase